MNGAQRKSTVQEREREKSIAELQRRGVGKGGLEGIYAFAGTIPVV
jgi:hypothetical protein